MNTQKKGKQTAIRLWEGMDERIKAVTAGAGRKVSMNAYINDAVLIALEADEKRLGIGHNPVHEEVLISSPAGVAADDITVISSPHVDGDTGAGPEAERPEEVREGGEEDQPASEQERVHPEGPGRTREDA